MTVEEYSGYVEMLQEYQMECINVHGIIFAMSVSASQLRVTVYTQLAPSQSFFLYKHADKHEGVKLLSKLNNFVRSITTWNELNLDKGNG